MKHITLIFLVLGWYWCSYNAIELGRETQKRLLVITPPERMLFNTINQVCSDLLLTNCRWTVKHNKKWSVSTKDVVLMLSSCGLAGCVKTSCSCNSCRQNPAQLPPCVQPSFSLRWGNKRNLRRKILIIKEENIFKCKYLPKTNEWLPPNFPTNLRREKWQKIGLLASLLHKWTHEKYWINVHKKK